MKKFSKIVTEIKPKENKNMSSQGRVTAGNSLPTDTGSPSLRSGHLTAGIWLRALRHFAQIQQSWTSDTLGTLSEIAGDGLNK